METKHKSVTGANTALPRDMAADAGAEHEMEWRMKAEPDARAVQRLIDALPGLHPVVARLMVQRNLRDGDSVKNFFKADISLLDEVGEMKDLDRAAQRLIRALNDNERILLYGDYDVDGTCSVAMMFRFLKRLGANVDHYIPDRNNEGYGVSRLGAEYAKDNGIQLMVTLDCGITAGEILGELQNGGIDVIVTDHHLPPKTLPPVYAVVNPNRSDCTYEGKELCGCGVAYVLILRIVEILGSGNFTQEELDEYLAYTAVATCSDIVPLTGVNRSIVSAGLRVLNTAPPNGIRALLQAAKFTGQLTVSEVVFKIGPRINAAGRLEHADRAVEILVSEDEEAALKYAIDIEKVNGERRAYDKQTAEEAMEMMLDRDPQLLRRTTVVAHPEWHKGIIGIVASRLMEKCYRPTIVFTESNGLLVGSGRSVEGFNLHSALNRCAEHIVKFGGHAAAAGLSVRPENLEAFERAFENVAMEILADANNKPKIDIDLELNMEDWFNDEYLSFYKQLRRMRPFGPSNLSPVFYMTGCRADRAQVVGKDHLKFSVFRQHKNHALPVIAFNMGEHFDALAAGRPFSLVYAIEEQYYKGRRSLQLNAKDIRFH